MSERYFIELFQPESPDELLSFHEQVIQMFHDQSEPFEDILTGAHYRSWVGLSYPVFGQLEQYVNHEISTDSTFRLNFVKDHPGLYLGGVVHCVSSKLNSLEAILQSASMSKLDEDSCSISDIQEVPSNCLEAVYRRDRRPEKRSTRHRSKSTKIFNIGSKQLPYNPPPITEPLPRVTNISKKGKRKPVHIGLRSSGGIKEGWFTMYGLSRQTSTVPLIPVQNTLFYSSKNDGSNYLKR